MRYKIMWVVSSCIFVYVAFSSNGVLSASTPPQEYHSLPTASQLNFEYKGEGWQIDLSLLGFDGVDPSTINWVALQKQVETVIKAVERPPRDAYFNKRQIVPHKNGRRVNREKLQHLLNHLIWHQNKVLTLPVIETAPKITTNTLSRLTEKVLGRYTTTFNPHNEPRVNNIDLSSRAIDYVIVPRGGLFSFNETVGPRTSERGYRPAPIIVKGEYSEGIGGGICQTSSTLFNSVDQAGLKIVERSVHSKRVTYVPKARDATVSWGGPDFKFKNNTNHPILIASDIHNGHITVTVYSRKETRSNPNKVPSPPQEAPQQERSYTR